MTTIANARNPVQTNPAAPAGGGGGGRNVTVHLRGARDRVLVYGDLEATFFPAPVGEGACSAVLAFSDGTILRAAFDSGARGGGLWHVERIHRGSGDYSRVPAGTFESDVATLTGPIDWIVCGSDVVKRRHHARGQNCGNGHHAGEGGRPC